MDILYSGEVEGFCIVSSDGDFNKLATRIREAGKIVIGMGEKKTPDSFRASCERFVFLDIIQNDIDAEEVDDEEEKTILQKILYKAVLLWNLPNRILPVPELPLKIPLSR